MTEELKDAPYAHGLAQCGACGYEWMAVWPLGADALECPQCRSTATDRDAEMNVDRGLNRQADAPAAPASNGPMVENPQGFQEGAPRSRGAHRPAGEPDQHPAVHVCRWPECACAKLVCGPDGVTVASHQTLKHPSP